ncbi:transporter substrate-binding domain-containing protein [Bacteroidales bacterium OttesenSCG-928-I21]|nr:transporter substrate-binding domain-containing protein [Bacteroidales bacterium OttesenSCG-928-I21]
MNKKYLMLSSLFFVLFAVVLLFFSDDDGKKDFSEIKNRGTLRVVTKESPLCYIVENDTICGFQYDLIKHYADSVGLELELTVENDLKKSIKGLRKGEYDIIARNLLVTTALRRKIDFSKPILLNKQILVQRADNEKLIRSHLDLAQETLYVTQDSPYILRIKNLAHEIGDTIYTVELENTSSAQLMQMVENGEIDYAVCDQRIAQLYKTPELDIKTDIGFVQLEAWAFRKNSPELEESINSFIDSFQKTETYKKIYKRYFESLP